MFGRYPSLSILLSWQCLPYYLFYKVQLQLHYNNLKSEEAVLFGVGEEGREEEQSRHTETQWSWLSKWKEGHEPRNEQLYRLENAKKQIHSYGSKKDVHSWQHFNFCSLRCMLDFWSVNNIDNKNNKLRYFKIINCVILKF